MGRIIILLLGARLGMAGFGAVSQPPSDEVAMAIFLHYHDSLPPLALLYRTNLAGTITIKMDRFF